MESPYTDGTVINQGIKAGTSAPAGTVINLVISGEGVDLASPVPDVFGQNITDATRLLERAGYSVAVAAQPSDKPADTVLKQSLQAGQSGFPIGTKITITISVAADSIKVADLKGKTLPEVLRYLTENNLTLGTVSFTSEGEATDYTVVNQTVAAGSYISPGTTLGVILFGLAKTAESVPSVVGMTEAGAVKALNDAWYRVEVEYEYANSTDGAVLRQSINPGTTGKAPGTKVTITVCIRKPR